MKILKASNAPRSGQKLFAVLSGLLVLSSCLKRDLPKTQPSLTPAEVPSASFDTKATPAPSERIQVLADVSTSRSDKEIEDRLLDVLLDSDGNPISEPFSMKEIAYLQARYLDYVKSKDNSAPLKLVETPAHNALKAKNCQPRQDTSKWVRKGLKLYKREYLKNKGECYFDNTEALQNVMNRLLENQTATLDLENGHQLLFTNFTDFMSELQAQGFAVRADYQIYLASFFRLHSVNMLTGVETDLPFPLWLDAGFHSTSGTPAVVPAVHSQVIFHFSRPGFEDLVEKIYFSDKGFVYDNEDFLQPEWAGGRELGKFTAEQLPAIFKNAQALHTAFDIFRSKFPANTPLNGFGILGVCNDGSAMLVKSLLPGFLLPFPLVRTELVDMPSEFPMKDIWHSLTPDTAESQINTAEVDRQRIIGSRLLNSYPFSNEHPSVFKDYEKFISELKSDLENAATKE